jgi:uncharacterized membrane protein
MFKWLLILHVLTACIWIGGHLLLSLRYLPEALKKRNPDIIKAFEKKYEIVGLPSLLLQVITGVWMAISYYQVNLFSFANPIENIVTIKLMLLLLTILLAIHVRFFIFPKLNADNLWWLALHIIAVTFISIVMLYLGVSIRFGGI